MTQGYKPKGWLGLLLGTRIYFRFYDAESLDVAAFEERVDGLAREIGQRGKPQQRPRIAEAVPPSAAAPAPAAAASSVVPGRSRPAPAPAPAPARTPTRSSSNALVAADQSFTPSMQAITSSSPAAPIAGMGMAASAGGGSSSAAEIAWLLKEMRQDSKLERDELRAEMERQRAEMEAKLTPAPAISDGQITALQARLEALHAAGLLSEEELFELADAVADALEYKAVVTRLTKEALGGSAAAGQVLKMVVLSEGMASDALLARQLRRKFCA